MSADQAAAFLAEQRVVTCATLGCGARRRKRVGLRFVPRSVASWDHRKL
jgi:hypothetical protein